MFSHVFLGVSDFDRALAFYDALMAVLGHARRFCERERPWAGWQPAGGGRPLLLIGRPFDGAAHCSTWAMRSRAVRCRRISWA